MYRILNERLELKRLEVKRLGVKRPEVKRLGLKVHQKKLAPTASNETVSFLLGV